MARGKTIGSMVAVVSATAEQFGADVKKIEHKVSHLKQHVAASAPTKGGVFDTLGNTASIVTGMLGLAGGAYAANRAIRSLLGTSREFSRAMSQSTAIMSGVTDQLRADMEKTARQVAFATKFSASEAAEAYFFLASAGFNASQSIGAMPVVAKFAQAGMFDLALATDLLTDAQSALGLVVKDTGQNMSNMTRLGNVLVKANTLANASVQQFSSALTTKAGASMKNFNQSMEAGIAVLAAFADQGVKGEEAGTQYSIVLRDITTKALQSAEAFRRWGIQAYDASGQVRSLVDIVGDLERAMEPLSDRAKKGMLLELGFSDKSIGSLLTLLGSSDKIRAYEAELRKASGTMDEVANANIPAIDRALNKLGAAWESFTIRVGSPLLEGFAKRLESLVDSLAATETSFSKASIQVGLYAAAFTATLLVVPRVITALSAMVTALRGVAIAQTVVLSFSGPAGWAAVAAGAATATVAVGLLHSTFSGLADTIQGAIDKSKEAAQEAQNQAEQRKTDADELAEATAQQAALNELMRRGAVIATQMRTPLEEFNDDLADLEKLLSAGAIQWQTYERAVEAAAEKLEKATEDREKEIRLTQTQGVGAVARGTSEGFSAVQSSIRQQLDEDRRRELTQKQQLEEQRKQTQKLDRIRDALQRGRETQVVRGVDI